MTAGTANRVARSPTIDDVRSFWERNPLFVGESLHEPGSLAFFEEHRSTIIDDCLAGRFDDRLWPPPENRGVVLDLGCGPGFWTTEFLRRGVADRVVAADLTEAAVGLTKRRLAVYGLTAEVRRENAEALTFDDEYFDHVNCQGVIHHTPTPSRAVAEIARVLKTGGTASISVYYRNVLISNFGVLSALFRLGKALGVRMPGRGREGILGAASAEECVRQYDGIDNPIGKSYSRDESIRLADSLFGVHEVFYHFFPSRSLPFRLPNAIRRFLDRNVPFLIYLNLRKH